MSLEDKQAWLVRVMTFLLGIGFMGAVSLIGGGVVALISKLKARSASI
jgi:hypothetical protein